jgi:DNA-binding MarR family transcriptional regulator
MLCMHNKFFTTFATLRKRMRREETVDHNIKAAWHSIARMYNQQAMKYDATMSMGFVLLNINSEEGTPATKIAPLMGLEARSLTRLLKSMEEKKLIYREADKNDKRSVRIRLSKEGKEKKERARETVLRFNNAVREEISDDRLNIFFEVLQRINQIVERDNIYEKVHD